MIKNLVSPGSKLMSSAQNFPQYLSHVSKMSWNNLHTFLFPFILSHVYFSTPYNTQIQQKHDPKHPKLEFMIFYEVFRVFKQVGKVKGIVKIKTDENQGPNMCSSRNKYVKLRFISERTNILKTNNHYGQKKKIVIFSDPNKK